MSDTIVLRRVYAVDSNTGAFLSSGQTLVTNNIGGTNWMDSVSSLSVAGGPILGYLPSTISSFSTLVYNNTAYFGGVSSMSTDMYNAISTLGLAISNITPGNITTNQITSTVRGLGSAGYFSTSGLSSLSTIGFVVQEQLISSISGLGTPNVNATQLTSSAIGYIQSGANISSLSLNSTIQGLGLLYPSTTSLFSTVNSLGTVGYISSTQLTSSLAGLGTTGFISSPSLTSTIQGLGFRYVSTDSLVSTVAGLSTFAQTCVRFDRTVNAYVQNCQVIFTSTASIGYFSTFTQSSVTLSQTFGTQYAAQIINTTNLLFSTASINLSPFSTFMTQSSIVTLDVYPHITFSRLADSATQVAVLPVSTFVQWSNTILSSPMVTTYLYAGNTTVTTNGIARPASNFYNTPIKLQFPATAVVGSTIHPYTLVHALPNGLVSGGNVNALSNEFVTPYFGNTGSVFVSIQNNP